MATYDAENGFVYVSNGNSNNVSVINGTTVVTSLNVGLGPGGLWFDSGNDYVYVANTQNYADSLSVIDGTKLVGTVNVSGTPVSVTYDNANGYAYVASTRDWSPSNPGALDVLNGTKVVWSGSVGVDPDGAIYSGDDGYVYVTNNGSGSVTVVNGTKVVGDLTVGSGPGGAVYDYGNGLLYVPNSNSNNVSAIATWSSVVFTETGLPSGANWSVTLNGSRVNTTSPTIVFSEPDGAYSYTVGSLKGYSGNPSSGVMTVNGTERSIAVTFTLTSTFPLSLGISVSPLTICAGGFSACPAGTGYARVTLSAVAPGNSSTLIAEGTAQPIFEFVPYGSVSVAPDPQMDVSCTTGVGVVLHCANTTVRNMSGAEVIDWNWSDTPSSNTLYGGDTWTVSFLVYASGPPYTTVPVDACTTLVCWAGGSAPVAGLFTSATYRNPQNSTVEVQSFSLASVTVEPTSATYPVTFSETGLASDINYVTWSVTLGGLTVWSNNSTIAYSEPNGTYSYAIGPVAGFTTPRYSGSVVVNGSATVESIAWKTMGYDVTFTETGLPLGTSWGVGISGIWGQPGSISSSTAILSMQWANSTLWGELWYSVGVGRTWVPGYTASPTSGGLIVNGANLSVSVRFSKVFAATVVETGLPSLTEWNVTLDGITEAGRGDIVFANLTNGTYPFSVGSIAGFAASPSSGSLLVKGSATTVTITFAAPQTTFIGLPATEGYALVGGVILAVTAAVVLLWRRGGKARPEPAKPDVGGPATQP